MKLDIVVTDPKHPFLNFFNRWKNEKDTEHKINVCHSVKDLKGGDLLIAVSCQEIISDPIRKKYKHSLVIHAGDLPRDRGWSPHIWQIIEGKSDITVSLLSMVDKVDAGPIWAKKVFQILPSDLYNEINDKLFETEIELIDFALENYSTIIPAEQNDKIKPNYRRKRTPKDSEIDIEKNISSQFNLLRVCDPERFPAFFIMNGQKFALKIEKIDG